MPVNKTLSVSELTKLRPYCSYTFEVAMRYLENETGVFFSKHQIETPQDSMFSILHISYFLYKMFFSISFGNNDNIFFGNISPTAFLGPEIVPFTFTPFTFTPFGIFFK
jgi:hypothetical protein